MSVATKKRALFLTAIGDDHTGAGAAYAALGSPTTQPVEMIVINSTFDTPVFLSVDGSNDHIFMPVNAPGESTSFTINFSESKQNDGKLQLPARTQFYMKQP